MLESFSLDTLYYGNTLAQWGVATIGVALSFLLANVVWWVATTIIEPLTRRTKTDLDDILLETTQAPVSLAFALIGSRLSMESLVFGEAAYGVVQGIFNVAIALNIAWLTSRVYDALHMRYLVPLADKTETDLDDQLLPILRSGVRSIIWFLAVVIGLNNAGYDVMAVLAGLGVGGVAFALAAQDTVANIFGGLTVMTTRPFRMGDYINVGGHYGNILSVGLRSSVLEAFDGEKITLPNKMFTESTVVDIDARPHYRVEQRFLLSHLCEPGQIERAMELCREVCVELDILLDPCMVAFSDITAEGFEIEFWFDIKLKTPEEGYIDHFDKISDGHSQCTLRLMQKMAEEKISLALPVLHRVDIHKMTGTGNFGL